MGLIENMLDLAMSQPDTMERCLIDTTLKDSFDDLVRYAIEQREAVRNIREQLESYQIKKTEEKDRFNTNLVSEPLSSYNNCLSFDSIVEFAESLESQNQIDVIQLMLYKLCGRKCTDEEYARIGDIKPKKLSTVTNNFYDNSQNVGTIKKQTVNHGRR